MVVRGGAQLRAMFVRPSPPRHHAQFLYPSSSTSRHFLLEALFSPKDISPFMEVLWSFSWLQTTPLSTIQVLSPLRSANFFCKRQDGTRFRFCGPIWPLSLLFNSAAHRSTKAATDKTYVSEVGCPRKMWLTDIEIWVSYNVHVTKYCVYF